ncbi:Mss4-like protein [Powellomyces hirtus]|nr:Mss4-like protein [Powellomyces hirtus]
MEDEGSFHGSCLCQRIRYKYTGNLGPMTVCHCQQCRKVQGACTVATIDTDAFTWQTGTEFITEHESSPGKMRAFCSKCGTALYSRKESVPGVYRMRVGTLDTPITQVPIAHIFTKELPPWASVDNDWPRCLEYETGAKR